MPTPLKNENTLSDPSNQKMARRFILAIPFYLAVPISFGLFFTMVLALFNGKHLVWELLAG